MNKYLVLLLLGLSQITLADIYIIVNPTNHNTLKIEDIRNIFLGKVRSFPDGSTAIAVELAESSPLRQEFNKKILNKDESQVRAYWAQMVFTGRATPPKTVDSEDEISKLVAKNPNIIGYVGTETTGSEVHVVLKK